MKTIEYHTTDKLEWGNGPWDDEPDKVQWLDETTGKPCLAVRNHMGAWCGYVGVTFGHPAFGRHYDDVLPTASWMRYFLARFLARFFKRDSYVEVHGGLTFADICRPHDRQHWEEWRQYLTKIEDEAILYPHGDAAREINRSVVERDDYDAWVRRQQAERVCHIPDKGDPDMVWWLGFDCAHAGDLVPGMRRLLRGLIHDGDVYRTLDYVKNECRHLAQQLS